MKLNVYSVFDVKAAVFAQPFYMPADAVAVRGFEDAVNRGDSVLGKHPEDYTLFRLGTFDDSTGKLESLMAPEVIITAATVKRVVKEVAAEFGISQKAVKEVLSEGK